LVEKLSRKDLKKPDELVSLTKNVTDWMVEQRVALLFGAAALAVVIIAVFGWQWFSESREKQASQLFTEARRLALAQQNPDDGTKDNITGTDGAKSEEEKYRTAIAGFEKVKHDFSRTGTAALATFYVGLYSQKLGDNDKAIEAYKDYLAREGFGGVLAAEAVEGVASAYESKQMTAEAVENYKRLCEPPFTSECDRGLYHLACLEQAAGKLQEAADNFKSILEKYPNTQFAQDIQERLLMLPRPTLKSAQAATQAAQLGQPPADTNKKEQ
jgi:tetratricopeptide (TPR) repeat protein